MKRPGNLNQRHGMDAPAPGRSLTVKEQRAAQIAAKLAEHKSRHEKARRKRAAAIIAAWAAAAVVVALLVVFAVTSTLPKGSPSAAIAGLQTFPGLSRNHVNGRVAYQQTPPVGGDHSQVLLNCAIYSQPVPNENAVHSLEHGSVWVTYDPAVITGAKLATLRGEIPTSYAILSPFQGLPSPVVASAWGAQIKVQSVDDPRITKFMARYRGASTAPEPGAACTGGIDGPGKVAR
ncbi:DUF3105 domain-containing protein [Arthrobacter sp. A2-55]|uniref:DUF3105 domain-containing protein n=1 Tax=Arthrobacter sp. A2-55 TaxID=2897337 RepID=UPI0021CDA269|nr:DUF3105 domain-containing protein [Arthrobacter sp. A2-55]MCU6481806.1 DUF3105 domain-containing protein [Arthrobacter sp. A2-55]